METGENKKNSNAIVFFDGECSFCNFWVRLILSRDKKKRFKFSSLSSKFAKKVLNRVIYNSVVVVTSDKKYFKSNAVLYILKNLGFLEYTIFLLFFPIPFKNYFYAIIAYRRNFIKVFKNCRLLSEEEKKRFVD